MTEPDLALAFRVVVVTEAVPDLAALAQRLRRDHPGAPEVDQVARVAENRRRRVVQER